MYLNILDRMTNNFQMSFLVSEILILLLYFSSFYFFLCSFTKFSVNKKIVLSFLFIFSLSQLLPFIYALRKQYFTWIFLLLYLGLCEKNIPQKIKIFLLGLLMSMVFFSHRWVSFYWIIFLVSLFLYFPRNKQLTWAILFSIWIWILVNISYFIPFLTIQANIIQDTIIAFINNIQVSSGASKSEEYLYRWFDMYKGQTNNTWISYFFADNILFLYLFSLIKFIRKDKFFIYFLALNLFIFFWSVMAGRLWHIANFFAVYFVGAYLFRYRRILMIFFFLFIISFSLEAYHRNIKNRYFSNIDWYLQNFLEQVPKKNTFLISLPNPFLRYSWYMSDYSAEAILQDSYSVYREKRELTGMLADFKWLFFLYWYDTVILPEYLRWYEIYVIFSYWAENHPPPEASKYFLQGRAKSINFLNSPFFELVQVQGIKSSSNLYGGRYPINYTFRLKKSTSVRYVPDDEIIGESIQAIRMLN